MLTLLITMANFYIIVSRSCTIHPLSTPLTRGGTVLKEYDDLDILAVAFNSKMTFKKLHCLVSRPSFQRLGILRKLWQVFHDRLLLGRCFQGLSCQFRSTVLQFGAHILIHTITLNYWNFKVFNYRSLALGTLFMVLNICRCSFG